MVESNSGQSRLDPEFCSLGLGLKSWIPVELRNVYWSLLVKIHLFLQWFVWKRISSWAHQPDSLFPTEAFLYHSSQLSYVTSGNIEDGMLPLPSHTLMEKHTHTLRYKVQAMLADRILDTVYISKQCASERKWPLTCRQAATAEITAKTKQKPHQHPKG